MKKFVLIMLCVAMVLASSAIAFADVPVLASGKLIALNPLAKYTDVIPGEWYTEGLVWCVSNNILNGKSETKMAPNDSISRAEIVTMLWRIEGSPVVNYFMQYKDVKADAYYGEAVRWASAEKIVTGYDAYTFKPDQAITREELATIIYKYEKTKGNGFTGSWMFLLDYPDAVKVSDWANEAMHWCVMKEIIKGDDGMLRPDALASRASAATMFMRLNPEVKAQPQAVSVLGGWSLFTEQTVLDLSKIPSEAKTAFDKATTGLNGPKLEPLAYLGSQVVAGVNYKFICRELPIVKDASPRIVLTTIYIDLQGNMKSCTTNAITESNIAINPQLTFPEAGLAGAYNITSAVGGFESVEYGTAGSTMKFGVQTNAKEAFEEATNGLLGIKYTPLMLCGTQLVAGTNYAMLCLATRVTAQPVSTLCVVSVYEPLSGTPTITPLGNFAF